MSKIHFFSEIKFSLNEKTRIRKWIKAAVEAEGKQLEVLSIIFCDDEYLLNLNQRYLNHDSLTDILTFDRSGDGKIAGDIYISIDRVRENAVTFQVDFKEELGLVIIHGVLHLLGFTDKDKESQAIMRSKEDEYLLLLLK